MIEAVLQAFRGSLDIKGLTVVLAYQTLCLKEIFFVNGKSTRIVQSCCQNSVKTSSASTKTELKAAMRR